MKVFKFGGGILRTQKDTDQLLKILENYKNDKLIIVVSAFNKITSKFETLLNKYFENKQLDLTVCNEIKDYHFNMTKSLFEKNDKTEINRKINILFDEIYKIFQNGLSSYYHYEYDKIVSYGELLSSTIIFELLKINGFNCIFEDIRNIIITDSEYTEAKVNWKLSVENIKNKCSGNDFTFCLTQGFIAADENGNTTTLGREGSDFSASVLAYALDAEEVIFWKEVAGIYNADPTQTSDYQLLPKLSYKESVEQAFYGAKILHPKTIKPLQNKSIPIKVKSFYKPAENGTDIIDISDMSPDLYPDVPIYIVKDNQILISLSTLDFSFISENNLGKIFTLLSKYRIKANLIQSSAISFSICITNNKFKIPNLIKELKENFSVLYNDDLSLITIRHYNDEAVRKMTLGKNILLRQNSRHTSRFVIK
ncbi:MAG: aspartate kinase [Bacteroidales bacterium]|nr:aspartate kinase [Bacteroidales bacterium]